MMQVPLQKYPDEFYIDVARNNPAFQQTIASAAIEGIYFSNSLMVEAGRHFVNEISYEQWSQMINKRHGIT